jgi:hypothetical protein
MQLTITSQVSALIEHKSSTQPSASSSANTSPFSSLYLVLNEFGEVVICKFLRTKGNDELKDLLTGLRARYDELVPTSAVMLVDKRWLQEVPYPVAWWTDNCCSDRPLIQSVFPDTLVTCLERNDVSHSVAGAQRFVPRGDCVHFNVRWWNTASIQAGGLSCAFCGLC